MLRLCILEYNLIKNKYPYFDQMPKGHILSGCDVEMIEIIGVLQYLYGIKTQYSCQGNHQDYLTLAYLLLKPNEQYPSSLLKLIEENNFHFSLSDDFNEKMKPTGLKRQLLRSVELSKSKNMKPKEIFEANKNFVTLLKNWAVSEIKIHLPYMKDSYFNEVKVIYNYLGR